jgi:hypothetical protein
MNGQSKFPINSEKVPDQLQRDFPKGWKPTLAAVRWGNAAA